MGGGSHEYNCIDSNECRDQHACALVLHRAYAQLCRLLSTYCSCDWREVSQTTSLSATFTLTPSASHRGSQSYNKELNESVKNNYKSPLLCFSCWHLMIFFCTSLPTWWTPQLLPFPYRPSFLFSILEDYCTQAVLQEACVWFSIYTAKIPMQTDKYSTMNPWIHHWLCSRKMLWLSLL